MKRVVLNRNNSLFVGNPHGGRTAAILANLTSSCRRHDVDPQLYLTQPLINLPTISTAELPAWLPNQMEAHSLSSADALTRRLGTCGSRSAHGICAP